MKVLGIDEAGRGPVIGSMFIGGFVTDEKDLDRLEDLGVKDSKNCQIAEERKLGKILERLEVL